MKQLIELEKSQIKTKRPDLRVGDIVRVEQKLDEEKSEKSKAGVQKSIFEGVVISIRNPRTVRATFTLRKVSFGVGVEKVFSLYSPLISKISILKRTKVRQAKLYYLRDRFGKKAKMKDKDIDTETIKMLGWDESDEQEKEILEEQKQEAEKAELKVKEMLESEDKAVVKEKPQEDEKKDNKDEKPEDNKDEKPAESKPEKDEEQKKD